MIFNQIVVAMFLHLMTSSDIQVVHSYRHDIPIHEYVAQLKFRLAALHAEETALKSAFHMNAEKHLLFSSVFFIQALDIFNNFFEFTSPNPLKISNYMYTSVIMTYYTIRMLKYIFKKGDIKAIEQELDALR